MDGNEHGGCSTLLLQHSSVLCLVDVDGVCSPITPEQVPAVVPSPAEDGSVVFSCSIAVRLHSDAAIAPPLPQGRLRLLDVLRRSCP